MSVFDAFFESQGFVVLDGGLATELENAGEDLRNPLWSAKILLSAPQKIADVHYAYFLAGADVAITCSYQATLPGLQAAGLSAHQAAEVIRLSVVMAKEARERFWSDPQNRVGRLRPLVAASIGPYGAFLHDGSEYRGDYGVSLDQLKSFHSDRLAVLTESRADLLACETIPSLLEAQALVELIGDASGVTAWVSFSCRDEFHISDGSMFSSAIAAVCQSPNVIAAGLNCTAPRLVNSLLDQARIVTNKPLVAYPNSGEIYDIGTSGWQSGSDVEIIERVAGGWRERGALLIGGCCRTTPSTIRAIRDVLSGPHAHGGSN
jgi:homocysteine S-methyltransferase